MAIPAATLSAVKNNMKIVGTAEDTFIQATYERVLDENAREKDWLAESEQISTVEDQTGYTTVNRAARVIGILHNKIQLGKTTSRSLDLLLNTWLTTGAGTPTHWFADQIPQSAGTLGNMREVYIYPKPNAAAVGSGDAGLTLYLIARPASDDPAPTWIDYLLIHRTVSRFILEAFEERERDNPQLEAVAMQKGEFFKTIADLWQQVFDKNLP